METTVAKRIKVLILVNTLGNVNSYVYGNHIGFFTWTAKNRPDIDIVFYTPQRTAIDMARTMAAKQALNEGCDYLMFLDDDVLVPVDALSKLLAAEKDIVAGLVIIRGYPFNVMAFRFTGDATSTKRTLTFHNDLETFDKEVSPAIIPEGDGPGRDAIIEKHLVPLQKVDAVGFSCCLISCKILQAIEPPYFVTGPHNTEDVYFCMKAQGLEHDNGEEVSIALHTGVVCGHMMQPEAVEWANRTKMQDYYYESAVLLQAQIPVRDMTHLDRSFNALGYKGVSDENA